MEPHDTFNFSPTAHNLDTIAGPVTLDELGRNPPGLRSTVNFYDDAATPTHSYSVADLLFGGSAYGSVLDRSGSGSISVPFAPADLNLYINQSADTVSVPQPLPTQTHLNIITGRSVPIDATSLGVATVYVDGMPEDAISPFSLRLLPGQHTVYTTGEDSNTFTVNPDGTISYDPSLEGAFTGAGTTSLRIVGRAVTVDATALAAVGFSLDDVPHDDTTPFVVRLLPGEHNLFTTGEDPNVFIVKADGTIRYDKSLDGFFSGEGTKKLTVLGATFQVNATALSAGNLYLDDVAHDPTKPFSVRLLPGQHSLFTLGTDVTYFTVNANATIGYDASLQGVLSGAGTSSLTITGRPITVDMTALGVSTLRVDGVLYNGSHPETVRLLPGQHEIASTIGTDLNWITVNNDGTITYDASLEGAFTGAGTSSLTITGRSITVDMTALGVSTLRVDGVLYDASQPETIRLLPGQHEIASTIGTDVNWITVNNDGTITYDASLEGAFSGAGTTTLTVAGRVVTFDPTLLGFSTIYVDGIAYDGESSFSIRLLPGQHEVSTENWYGYQTGSRSTTMGPSPMMRAWRVPSLVPGHPR